MLVQLLLVSAFFDDMRDDPEFPDVTMVCEEEQHLKAHRILLVKKKPFSFSNNLSHKSPPLSNYLFKGRPFLDSMI